MSIKNRRRRLLTIAALLIGMTGIVILSGCVSYGPAQNQTQTQNQTHPPVTPSPPSAPATPNATPSAQPPAEQYSVDVLSYPTTVNASTVFSIFWNVNGTNQVDISHTAVHYGPVSVPDPKGPSDYPYVSKIQGGTIPKTFSVDMNIANPGTYYFRAHAIVNGMNVWSDEKIIIVTSATQAPPPQVPSPQPQATNYFIEADDAGFYTDGSSVSSIIVIPNSTITLTFSTRTANVYHGGLDFRSSRFDSQTVLPGTNWTTPEIIVDAPFVVSSYWPSTGVKKADLQISFSMPSSSSGGSGGYY